MSEQKTTKGGRRRTAKPKAAEQTAPAAPEPVEPAAPQAPSEPDVQASSLPAAPEPAAGTLPAAPEPEPDATPEPEAEPTFERDRCVRFAADLVDPGVLTRGISASAAVSGALHGVDQDAFTRQELNERVRAFLTRPIGG